MNPEAIEKLIDQGRDGYEARLAAGQARLKGGDLAQAIDHLEKATDFRPDQTMAWQELGGRATSRKMPPVRAKPGSEGWRRPAPMATSRPRR
jgi:predicted Zn-dependent protease